MKDNLKKLTSILCVVAILVSTISVAAFACLFCDETTQPPVETTTQPPKEVPPPKIPPTDSFYELNLKGESNYEKI